MFRGLLRLFPLFLLALATLAGDGAHARRRLPAEINQELLSVLTNYYATSECSGLPNPTEHAKWADKLRGKKFRLAGPTLEAWIDVHSLPDGPFAMGGPCLPKLTALESATYWYSWIYSYTLPAWRASQTPKSARVLRILFYGLVRALELDGDRADPQGQIRRAFMGVLSEHYVGLSLADYAMARHDEVFMPFDFLRAGAGLGDPAVVHIAAKAFENLKDREGGEVSRLRREILENRFGLRKSEPTPRFQAEDIAYNLVGLAAALVELRSLNAGALEIIREDLFQKIARDRRLGPTDQDQLRKLELDVSANRHR
jgi:hypothetical protein